MKQRMLALFSLLVSLVALAAAVWVLNRSIVNNLPNKDIYLILIVAVGFIVLICAVNYIFSMQKVDESPDESDEDK